MMGKSGQNQRRWQLVWLAVLAATVMAAVTTVAVTHSGRRDSAVGTRLPGRASAVLFLGDSYTAGVGADHPQNGFAGVLSRGRGWIATVDGIGGTGFTAAGPVDGRAGGAGQYPGRIDKWAAADLQPLLVVLQGGQNDAQADSARLSSAVESTVARARQAWPLARIVVIGPSPPYPVCTKFTHVSSAVREGAQNAGVPFVDAVGLEWFTAENSSKYAFSDQQHLNTAGHSYLAARISASLEQIQSGS